MPVRTFVFGLLPTRAQHASLRQILDDQRNLYNAALQERRDAWSKSKTSISMNDQTRSLTEIRKFDDSYGEAPYNLSKWTLKRLDDAFKAFFRRAKKAGKAGFPRFRSAGRWRSFGFHQKDGLRLKGDRLLFSGRLVGGLRIRMHRPIPEEAVIKSAIFTLEGGIWRVALACEVPVTSVNDNDSIIGIDVGVAHLATDSEGCHYTNVRPLDKRQKKLRRAARGLARSRRGSKRRKKAVARLQRAQRRVRNHRRTHLHDVANAIVRSATTIVVEDLKLKNMIRSARGSVAEPGRNVRQKAGLNRVLADAAPGRLISMIAYKAESAGGRMIKVDPRNTSTTCSACDVVDMTQLSRTRYRCRCGLDLHRDHNAAINIRKRGISALHEAARALGDANVTGCGVRRPVNAEPLAA